METHTVYRNDFDASAPKRIDLITIEWKDDESPDLSWLGEYANKPEGAFSFNRKEGTLIDFDGEIVADGLKSRYSRHEFEWIVGFQHTGEVKGWSHVSNAGVHSAYLRARYRFNGKNDFLNRKNLFAYYGVKGWETAQTREQKIRLLDILYCCDDAMRLDDFSDGKVCMMGCTAKAEVSYPAGNGSRRLEWFSSGGLWGIESDASKEYVAEVEREQLSELRAHLEQFGVEWPADLNA